MLWGRWNSAPAVTEWKFRSEVRDPVPARDRLTRWNSWTDGQSPDGKRTQGRWRDRSSEVETAAVARCPGVRDRTGGAPDREWDLQRDRAYGDAPRPRAGGERRRTAGAEPAGGLRPARRAGPHDRRGSPPRRRNAARRGRRARPGRRLGLGRHGGRDARALQPHRPHRSLLAGAGGGRRTTGGRRPARRQPGRGRWRGDPAGRRRRGRDRPPGRRGAGPQPGVDLRHRARPPVRHLEVRHHPRRAQCRRRRHEPLGLQPGGAARHPSPARPVRHDAGRHRHRRDRRPPSHGARRGRHARCRASRSAW